MLSVSKIEADKKISLKFEVSLIAKEAGKLNNSY